MIPINVRTTIIHEAQNISLKNESYQNSITSTTEVWHVRYYVEH